jgi:serine/threonine protein kinase/formylglycine-generating enzyme required for sulfatase activity
MLETADISALSRPPVALQPHREVNAGAMIGKYRVLSVLGRGGMGNVYLASDPLIQREVAIKVLPAELVRDPESLARFLAEAQSAGRLNHANVVTIYEVIQFDGSYAIAMELVGGGSVQDYLNRKGAPGWRAATRIIAEACKALVAAHEKGLIHRDIKPANLLLTRDGHVKVADFGLAKMDAGQSPLNTQPGTLLGTPAYMSPEQCRGDVLDCRTDIYSLGCTYYTMLTGRLPFEAASSMQVMFGHCSSPIPDPRKLAADVPDGVAKIIARAMAKNSTERYANAREMLVDLRAALTSASTAAPDARPAAAALVSNPSPPAQSVSVAPPKSPRLFFRLPRRFEILSILLGLAALGVMAIHGLRHGWFDNLLPAPIPHSTSLARAAAPATMPAMQPLGIVNSVKMQFVLIRPGKFLMGDAALPDAPPHEVTITRPFYIGEYDVTQGELHLLANTTVGRAELAAGKVHWLEANKYCSRLSELPEEREARRVYRLPTEAEWEYACRAGATTRFSSGDTLAPKRANFGKSPVGDRVIFTSPGGRFPPNPWGLYDMHGNVMQWCSDFYAPTYDLKSTVNPTGPATGVNHVARGGCWNSTAAECASAYRASPGEAVVLEGKVGFRLVFTIKP